MKRLIFTLGIIICITPAFSQNFTSGNLVVERLGTGTGAPASSGTAIFLDEYTTSGTLVQSLALPTTTVGSVNRLVESGTATSDGQMNLSDDGTYLSTIGYDAATGTASVASATGINRVVAIIDVAKNIYTQPFTESGTFNTNNIRSAVMGSCSGPTIWMAGTGSSSGNEGIRSFTGLTSSTSSITAGASVTISNSPITNTRVAKIFNGNLYFTTSSTTAGVSGVYHVGTGLPTTAGQTSTELVQTVAADNSPYSFLFLSVGAGYVCYVADDGSGSGGTPGIYKYSSPDMVTWTARGSITSAVPLFGLTGSISGGLPVLFATASNTTGTVSSLLKLTDNAAAYNVNISGTFSTLVTAGTNKTFRSVSFAPSAIAAAPATQASNINFTSVGLNSMTVNWTNGNGLGRIVKANTTNSFTNPTNGAAPGTANPVYTSGEQLVYNGTANTVNISGLNPGTNYWFRVYEYNNNNGLACTYKYNTTTATNNPNSQATTSAVVPTVSTSTPSLSFGTVVAGNTAELNYSVSGSNLTNDIVINAPTGFGVSTVSGGPYNASLNLTEVGGNVGLTTIYVGFSPASAIAYSGNVTNASTGATTQNVAVTGNGVNPALTLTGPLTAFGNQNAGTNSAPQSFTVSGTNLVSNVTVTAPAGFAISTSQCTGYTNSVTIIVAGTASPQGGTLATTTLYAEFQPAAATGYSGNISGTATNATTQNLAVTGTGVAVPSSFSTGTLVLYVVGDGCNALGSGSVGVSLQEYTVGGGATGYEIQVPSAGASAFTNSGSATSEGQLALSQDKAYVTFGGYNGATGVASIASTTAAADNRALGTVKYDGSFSELTSATFYDQNNCRGGVSDGCNNFWSSGTGSSPLGGVNYFGSVNGAGSISGTVQNIRAVNIFNSQLYFSTASGTPGPFGIWSVGTGVPNTSGQTSVNVINTGASSSPYGFSFDPTGTICYIADDRTAASGGGIIRYNKSGGVWTLAYTLKIDATNGARSVTVDYSGANPVIYALAAASTSTGATKLVKITDTGAGSAFSLLATSTTNTVFRGVAFSPAAPATPTVQANAITFSSIVAGNMTVSWANGNGNSRLVKMNLLNSFTAPVDNSTYSANAAWQNAGEQVVYNGTGNSVVVSGLNPNSIYWVEVYEYNNLSACTKLYNTSTASDNPIPNAFVWTGIISTNWGTATNWNTGVVPPNSCSSNIYIQSGTPFSPTLGTASSVGDIFVGSAATLTLNANLSVCGGWTGGNTTTATVAGAGIVVLNGAAAQKISGNTTFNELRLNNSLGAAMQAGSKISIGTSLDLQAGNFNSTNGAITFTSNSVTQIAILDNFSAGYTGTFTGNITAQRYYGFTYNSQHMLGSPVNAPSMTQMGATGTSGYIIPLPNCDEQVSAANSPWGTVFSYHESNGSTCGQAQWFVETAGNANNAQGYSVVLAPANRIFALTGAPNLSASYSQTTGNSNWNNTTLQNRHESSGWMLMSNPYLATLNLTTANAGFDSQVQIWEANGPHAGSYQAFSVNSNAVIAPFQAFMVHKTSVGGSATYAINATDRTRSVPSTFYNMNDNELDISLQNNSTTLLDETMIAFNSNATDGFDPAFDANKFGGSLNRHTLYTLCNGNWMAKNVLNSINTTSTVDMGLEPGATGSYTMTFTGINSFDASSYIYLEDKQTGTMVDVRNGNGTYTFNADSADNWNRFVLHFTPPVAINTANASCTTAGNINITQPGTANWNYTITDANNQVIASGILNQTSPVSVNAQTGTYTLTLVDNNNYTVTKTITVNGAQDVVAGFTASATTVNTQTEVGFTSTSQNAITYAWNFGDGTSSTSSNTNHVFTQAGTYVVTLTVTSQTGCVAVVSQTITVSGATAINNTDAGKGISLWSSDNKVYVDFRGASNVDAIIKIYNILGQELSTDKYNTQSVYQKEINDIDAAYVMVSVNNAGQIATKKLFIINTNK